MFNLEKLLRMKMDNVLASKLHIGLFVLFQVERYVVRYEAKTKSLFTNFKVSISIID